MCVNGECMMMSYAGKKTATQISVVPAIIIIII